MNMLPCAAALALASSVFTQTTVVSSPPSPPTQTSALAFTGHIHARPTRNYLHADDFRLEHRRDE